VVICPKKSIAISKKLNKSGYFPAQPVPSVACGERGRTIKEATNTDSFDELTTSCTGCCFCALICPDAAIEVFRENKKVVSIKSGKKGKPNLIKEM